MLEEFLLDKTPWLSTKGINSYDLNNMAKDPQVGLGRFVGFVLGALGPFVYDFQAGQTVTPSMSISLTQGQIYQTAPIDASPIGTFEADSRTIIQQGWCDAQTISLNTSGLTAGQEKWWLIEVRFQELDVVRSGDPTGGARGFYNSADPTNPLNGIDGLGGIVPTVRQGKATVSAIAGAPAAAGSAIPPDPSGGNAPLFLIKVSYGQSAITNGQIQLAGPDAYAGYPYAPFISGLLNQHHRGINGHAPQIVLGGATKEVQGTMDMVNLPATNQVESGILLPTIRNGTGDPNGVKAGNVGDFFLQTDADVLWTCKTSGNAAAAVWIPNTPISAVLITTFPYTIAQSVGSFFAQLSTGNGVINLPPANKPRRFRLRRVDATGFQGIITPNGTDKIWKDDALLSLLNLNLGESIDLESVPSLNTYFVL
jgi:hypothetical protein